MAGFDGSAESRQALRAAWQLARRTGAKLKLVAVAVPPALGAMRAETAAPHLLETIHDGLRERLIEARSTVPDDIEVEATLVSGDAVEALKDMGGAPGTIMVVGSRGYGPLRRVLLGSVSTKLMQSTPCPLIVTPRGAEAERSRGKQAA